MKTNSLQCVGRLATVVIAVASVLCAVLFVVRTPPLPVGRMSQADGSWLPEDPTPGITCFRNMKEIGLCLELWKQDHNDQYPWNVSTNEGGTRELTLKDGKGFATSLALQIQALDTRGLDLGNIGSKTKPVVLVCPQDWFRMSASQFSAVNDQNITYRLRLSTNTSPQDFVLFCPVHGHMMRPDLSIRPGTSMQRTAKRDGLMAVALAVVASLLAGSFPGRRAVKLRVIAGGLAVITSLLVWRWPRERVEQLPIQPAAPMQSTVPMQIPPPMDTPAPVSVPVKSTEWHVPGSTPKIKSYVDEFTDQEKAEIAANFEKRYKPAIEKWAKAWQGHLPINPDDITMDAFKARVGMKPSFYAEYTFVVNGVTVGVADKQGHAYVDYANVREQTQQMMVIPTSGQAPDISTPVTRQEVSRMVEADGGIRFPDSAIRIIPSALSGSLSGGMLVDVGGDPQRGGSEIYSLVFSRDGNLAYYMYFPH